jgi:hypothetical protein
MKTAIARYVGKVDPVVDAAIIAAADSPTKQSSPIRLDRAANSRASRSTHSLDRMPKTSTPR